MDLLFRNSAPGWNFECTTEGRTSKAYRGCIILVARCCLMTERLNVD